MTDLTSDEMQDLLATVANNFGTCICRPGHGYIQPFTCPGHQFLSEHDRVVSRLDKLTWIRRTSREWERAEWTGRCKQCGEVAAHTPGSAVCVPCSVLDQVTDAKLPW